ncbi:class I SAM-dependent methyltransferase [Saccharolobus caldissimus]|uniref:Class I SAM-dependent methyltransferase n=1 Tax=Saccharolobus caldissimus TaxID=1702097 RepID=A0AAQ4CTM1_9CREN|nr:class I SAM-dependent methyltransferase [Saccharolobus caldissimus]BDB99152.1 hypothetical protein SACC_21690 [Saccharolobus caldissimus]
METIRSIFNVDFNRYWSEAEKINNRVKKILGSSFSYALSENKRAILYSVVKYFNPDVVIETGVGPGVSSTFILYALNKGVLYSIDVRETLENGRPVGFLVPHELRNKWKLYIGKSREVLPSILRYVNKIDIFLHDSEHTYENVMFELNTVWNHLRDGGIIFIDNFEWTEAPYHFAREKNVNLYKLVDEAGGLAMIIKK